MGQDSEQARSLALRAARGAVLAIAAVWSFWLVGAQALLWTPLLRALVNAESPAVHLEYSFAWSVWPGVVHARGLVITAQDRAVQWRLAIDRVSARIALGQLPSRLFHASQVRARGVAFAVRRRIGRDEMLPGRIGGLPRIEGFPHLPLKAEGPDDELPESRYRLYSVWLEDVEGEDVRQIWFDQLRLEGKARVAGAFYLKPLRQVLVAPAELRIEQAEVLRGAAKAADRIQGALRLRLDRFDPRGARLEQIAKRLDLDADLRARLAELPFARGEAVVSAAVHVAAGKVQRGTRFDLKAAQARAAPARAGLVELHAAVEDGLHAVGEARSVRLPGALLGQGRIELSGEAPDLSALQPPARASIDLRGGRIEDARALQRLFTDQEHFGSGQGTFSAHLEGPPRKLSGWARVRLSRVRLRARGRELEGDARIDATVARLDASSADLAGTRIAIRNGRLSGEDIAPAWWGRIVLQKATVQFEGPRLETSLAAHCRDARPIVGLFAHLADLPGIVKGLFSMDGLSLDGSATVAPGSFALRDLVARGDGASIEAAMRQGPAGQRGAALLTVHGIRLALDLDGGTSLHLFGPGDFYAERKKELDALPAPSARRGPARRR